jgi:hypothetical protein
VFISSHIFPLNVRPCRTGAATQAGDETEEEAGDEYRLGTFELRTNSNYSQSEK